MNSNHMTIRKREIDRLHSITIYQLNVFQRLSLSSRAYPSLVTIFVQTQLMKSILAAEYGKPRTRHMIFGFRCTSRVQNKLGRKLGTLKLGGEQRIEPDTLEFRTSAQLELDEKSTSDFYYILLSKTSFSSYSVDFGGSFSKFVPCLWKTMLKNHYLFYWL